MINPAEIQKLVKKNYPAGTEIVSFVVTTRAHAHNEDELTIKVREKYNITLSVPDSLLKRFGGSPRFERVVYHWQETTVDVSNIEEEEE